jgi:hypothetical protein
MRMRSLVLYLFLAVTVLTVVSNRESMYLGGEYTIQNSPLAVFDVPHSNEFIYGGATVLLARNTGEHYWGGRYLTIAFIRPIPRALWPSKYEKASEWFGLPSLEENIGTRPRDFYGDFGWVGAVGSAPGIVADSWLEFSWLFLVFLYFIGRIYSSAWKNFVERGGPWALFFVALTALSGYLVMQTFEAMFFRGLFMVLPSLILWKIVFGSYRGDPVKPDRAPDFSPRNKLE